jgi:hypothetical protein
MLWARMVYRRGHAGGHALIVVRNRCIPLPGAGVREGYQLAVCLAASC